MSEPVKSKHATLLNALDDMQQSMMYAVRRTELREAEGLIVAQEKTIDTLQAQLAQVEGERDTWHKDATSHLNALCEKQAQVNQLESDLAAARAIAREVSNSILDLTQERDHLRAKVGELEDIVTGYVELHKLILALPVVEEGEIVRTMFGHKPGWLPPDGSVFFNETEARAYAALLDARRRMT